ncbi:G2 and S phase-expressed protein 1-like isoform X2 [Hippocampus zosterae]|uniref:G2 and S phase-expressed protein 1-like isoform X2 n=1 Tax=Hippocampus zosterae TaxID=109293 RepID=UPI00223D3313|nr:G2 and S phase-expressed protein 1-like isoform X2 [Hippocampus zosterae]
MILIGIVPAGRKGGRSRQMESPAGSDVIYLLDEKFDFDVSLSPDSSNCDEDADDVFVEPSRHAAKRAPANSPSRLEEGAVGARGGWSPLSGVQLDAVCQEAKRLAEQLRLRGQDEAAASAREDGERFIRDGAAKLAALATPPGPCGPVKRQTFLVQDSPMKELPPAIRHRLRRGSAEPGARATGLSARLGASSPAGGVKTAAPLRGRAALLPSKPAAPRTSSSTGRGPGAQNPRVAPGCEPSPSPDLDNRARRPGWDLPSDGASAAHDVGGDSPLSSGAAGKKRPLAPPNKVSRSGAKATPLQSRKPAERRKMSSSSSSVSSVNSSLSLSPAAGKPNSSQNHATVASGGPAAPGKVGQPANQNKRRSGAGVKTATQSSSSLSSSFPSCYRGGQARNLSETVKASGSSLQSQTTPLKRRTSAAATARIQSGLKAKSKPAALGQTPTPGRGVTGTAFSSPDASKVLKPKTLMAAARMQGLQAKASGGPLTPSAGASRPLQLHSQRPSALPTPLKRRASAIPAPTPGSQSRNARPPRKQAASDSDCPPRTCFSPAPLDWNRAAPVDVQPFCLEEEPPAEPSQSQSPQGKEPSRRRQSEPGEDPVQPESAKREVLLLDLPAPMAPTHEKLLIDLRNTPDWIRNGTKNCTAMQLIDLSSPLIKWSPEDKKENSAPLINLSF